MTHDETLKILGILRVAYPASFSNLRKADAEALTNLWVRELGEFDQELVSAAVDAAIRANTSNFAPSIGAVIEQIRFISTPERMTAAQAWRIVQDAAREAERAPAPAFKSLPADLQELVGSWENLLDIAAADVRTLSVMRSRFYGDFEAVEAQRAKVEALPLSAREYRAQLLGSQKSLSAGAGA